MSVFHLRGLLVAVLALAWLGGHAPQAAAATLDFETIGASGTQPEIADGYGDLTWTNFYAIDGNDYAAEYPDNGYINGATSGAYVGVNGFGKTASFSSTSTFDFISASLTAAFNEGLKVDIAGYLDGTQLYSKTVTLSTQIYATLLFNWTGINMVTFKSYGGVPVYDVSGRQFALDDLTVVKTPIPPALLLLATGLVGLGIAARRRKAAASV